MKTTKINSTFTNLEFDEQVSCLLELGADVTQRAAKNRTAYELAEYQKRQDVIQVLEDYNNKRSQHSTTYFSHGNQKH